MLSFVLVSLPIVAAVFAWLRIKHGPRTALGGSMLASFCFPSYWIISILGMPFSVQTLSAVLVLTLYVLTGGSLRFRLTMCDLAVGFMLAVHFVSDGFFHGAGWSTIFSAYGEWMLPYGAGRYAFGSVSGMRPARYIALGVFLVGAMIWILDLFAGMNIAYELTTAFSDWEPPRRAKRFSLVRSAGLTEHPIFFSGMMLALLPAVAVAFSKNRYESPLGRYLIALTVLTLVSLTLSRAAVLACVVVLVVGICVHFPRVRIAMGIAFASSVLLVACFSGQAKALWMKTGDLSDERKHVMMVNGKEVLHSSTLARLRVYDVYGRSAMRAGLLGYGSVAVNDFPPNVPYLPREASATQMVWTVENSYLLSLLRFGWLGLLGFVSLMASPLALLRLERDLDRRRHMLTLSFGILSMAVLLFTVYPDYQMVFPTLWLLGLLNAVADSSIIKDVVPKQLVADSGA